MIARYLGPAWLFVAAYLIISASILMFFALAEITGYQTEPIPLEGLSLGACDITKPYTVNQEQNSVKCVSPDQRNFEYSCSETSDKTLLLSFDQNTGEVTCRPNPDMTDEVAAAGRARAFVDSILIAFSAASVAIAAAMIAIGGKGLLKMAPWSFRPAILLSMTMIGVSIAVILITLTVIIPELAMGGTAPASSTSIAPALLAALAPLFLVKLAAGMTSLAILLRTEPARVTT